MGIWDVRIWNVRCVRCRAHQRQEDCYRKEFVRNLRSDGWYIRERKTLCPRCRELQKMPKQDVTTGAEWHQQGGQR